MAFTITNRAKHLLIIPLNSGESLYLAPGEASDPIEAYELDNNEKVDKLLSNNLIASSESEGEAQAAATGDAQTAASGEAQAPAAVGTQAAAGVESQSGAAGGATGSASPADAATGSAVNASPAPDASSVAPGAPPPAAGPGPKGKH
jgi:hypothetical protein